MIKYDRARYCRGLEQTSTRSRRKVIQQVMQSPGFYFGESFRDLEAAQSP